MKRTPVPVATHRAVLRSAWLAAQHRMAREGVARLTPREEAGRLLERWVDAFVAQTFAKGETWSELDRVVREEKPACTR